MWGKEGQEGCVCSQVPRVDSDNPRLLLHCVLCLCVCSCLQCIRRLDRTTLNGYRLTVERAKTDLR